MDDITLMILFFYSYPEEILLFTLGTAMFLSKLRWKEILIAALISSVLSYILRKMPIYFGVHTLIGLLINYLLFYFLIFKDYFKSLSASLFSLGYLIVVENIITQPLALFWGYSGFSQVWPDDLMRILISYPTLLILGITSYIIFKKQIFNNNSNYKRHVNNHDDQV